MEGHNKSQYFFDSPKDTDAVLGFGACSVLVRGWNISEVFPVYLVVRCDGQALRCYPFNDERPDVVASVLSDCSENSSYLLCGFNYDVVFFEKLEIGFEVMGEVRWVRTIHGSSFPLIDSG